MPRDIVRDEIVNWSTMPDGKPVGKFYKTKNGAMNYLMRVFIGPQPLVGLSLEEGTSPNTPHDVKTPILGG